MVIYLITLDLLFVVDERKDNPGRNHVIIRFHDIDIRAIALLGGVST